MWQLFLERFVAVMEDDPSVLDARDGVGPQRPPGPTSGEPVGGRGSAATPPPLPHA